MKYKDNKRRYSKFYIRISIILIMIFTTVSCQKTSQITINMGGSSYDNGVNEIKIIDRKYHEVLEQYQEMLQQVSKNSIGEADIYNNMGGIYAEYEKDQKKAEEYLNKAIKIHKDKKDEVGLAGDYTEMSKIYIYIGGDIEEGIRFLEQAEEIYIRLGMENVFGLAGVMINKGHLYKKAERYEDALNAYKKAEEIYKNRREENPTIYVFIGQIYVKMQQYKIAEEQYIKAVRISKMQNNNYLVAEIEYQLGWLYSRMDKYNSSIEQYTQALEFYKTNQIYTYDIAYVYNNMAFAYSELGETEKALEYAISSYQALKKIEPVTAEIIDMEEHCISKLKQYYQNCSNNMSEEEFEKWFRENVK